jgi:mRNA interferase MazF
MTFAAQEPRAALCRGTVVTVASPGAYSGKPRPAVVVQADRWLQAHPSVTLCPLTSTLMEAPLVRIAVEPSTRNGLRKPSQLTVDKLFIVPIEAVNSIWPCVDGWSCHDHDCHDQFRWLGRTTGSLRELHCKIHPQH